MTNLNPNTIVDSDEAWDSRELGADANYVGVCSDEEDAEIDAMMQLQPISIRLPKSLVQDFKMIAEYHGVGYQPLMRDILCRFAQSETRKIAQELIEAREQALQESLKELHQHNPATEDEKKCA